MLTVCMERKRFSLKMVIDSEIEMPSRFYIATLFQLLNVVKNSCFALGWEKNCHADGKIEKCRFINVKQRNGQMAFGVR